MRSPAATRSLIRPSPRGSLQLRPMPAEEPPPRRTTLTRRNGRGPHSGSPSLHRERRSSVPLGTPLGCRQPKIDASGRRAPLDQVLSTQALEDREHRRVGPVGQLIRHFPARQRVVSESQRRPSPGVPAPPIASWPDFLARCRTVDHRPLSSTTTHRSCTTTFCSSTVPVVLLDDASLPPLAGHEFVSTQFDFVPVAMILVALVLYLWAVKRNNALHPRHPWSVGKTVAWLGALFTTGVGIFSFVGVYDGELFWDHMVQHLILIMVAAPLFAIASPSGPGLALDLGHRPHRRHRGAALRVAKLLGHPVTAFVLYAVIIPVSHLTSWYNLTLEHESVHNAEHLAFLVVGYLFWRQIFGSDPNAIASTPPCSSSTYSWRSRSTPSRPVFDGRPMSSSLPISPHTGPGGLRTSQTSTWAATSCGSSATPSCCGR